METRTIRPPHSRPLIVYELLTMFPGNKGLPFIPLAPAKAGVQDN